MPLQLQQLLLLQATAQAAGSRDLHRQKATPAAQAMLISYAPSGVDPLRIEPWNLLEEPG
jgi:hypothetical protein